MIEISEFNISHFTALTDESDHNIWNRENVHNQFESYYPLTVFKQHFLMGLLINAQLLWFQRYYGILPSIPDT